MSTKPSDADVASDVESTLTPRRKFVFFGALAAATLLPGAARAQGRTKKRRPSPANRAPIGLDPSAGQPSEDVAAFAEWDTGGLSRLVRRATMGITPAEVARATQLGWNGYLSYQLN